MMLGTFHLSGSAKQVGRFVQRGHDPNCDG